MRIITVALTITIMLFILSCTPNPIDPNIDAPVPATNLRANLISPTRVLLTWTDNSTNETGFKIER